jgi:hypothetical protein
VRAAFHADHARDASCARQDARGVDRLAGEARRRIVRGVMVPAVGAPRVARAFDDGAGGGGRGTRPIVVGSDVCGGVDDGQERDQPRRRQEADGSAAAAIDAHREQGRETDGHGMARVRIGRVARLVK